MDVSIDDLQDRFFLCDQKIYRLCIKKSSIVTCAGKDFKRIRMGLDSNSLSCLGSSA